MGDLTQSFVLTRTELALALSEGGVAMTKWHDDNPFVLIIVKDVDEAVIIDLGEPKWLDKYADWMRVKSRWFLARKPRFTDDRPDGPLMPVLWLNVEDGDQPYYTARHTGIAGVDTQNEVVSYGIGAKRANGAVDRMWVLPNGLICVGEDVDTLALHLVKANYGKS